MLRQKFLRLSLVSPLVLSSCRKGGGLLSDTCECAPPQDKAVLFDAPLLSSSTQPSESIHTKKKKKKSQPYINHVATHQPPLLVGRYDKAKGYKRSPNLKKKKPKTHLFTINWLRYTPV